MKTLSFGEILWDIYPDKKYIGGAPLNFAAHLARHGHEAYMLSAVGRDTLGESALKQLEAWGVSSKFVEVIDGKDTGSCVVTLDKNSVPSYKLLSDVAYDYIPCNALVQDFDVLYFGTLAQRSSYNKASLRKLLDKCAFKEIFADVNIRPPFYDKESVRFTLERATILKISLEELDTVAELLKIPDKEYTVFARFLSQRYRNLKGIIITLGADGAWALDCLGGVEYFCSAQKTSVVSTVGAGDSFSAAFLHKYLKGQPLQNCLEYASRVAGFVVSEYDAVPEYKVEDFN